MNCEQFIDGIFDAELQELRLCEEFEDSTQEVDRAQFLELANKTARARSNKLSSGVAECTRLDVWSDQRRSRGRLVNSVIPAPHSKNLLGQDPTQRHRQSTGLDSTGNRHSNANHGDGRPGCFECGQMSHFAKKCQRKASLHLNYRGPGQ